MNATFFRALAALALFSCGNAPSTPSDGGTPALNTAGWPQCAYSTANSGTLCQVNFGCDDGELAMYCAGTACDCRRGGTKEKEFEDTQLCELEGDARVARAVETCGWGT